MKKAHQEAFNKALLKAVKYNSDKRLVPRKDSMGFDVMVPVATVLAAFRPFTKLVEKDLKLKKKAKAAKKGKKNVR